MMQSQRVRVCLTPLGQRIKYRIVGTVYRTRQGTSLPNSRTLDRDDLVWVNIFGSLTEVQRFIHRNRSQIRIVALTEMGYDACDRVR